MSSEQVSRVIEDTITDIFASMLRERNISVVTQVPLQIPGRARALKPDLVIKDTGIYVGEAKLEEGKLINDVQKIYENYIKYHKALGIRGAFAIKYPESLTKLPPDSRVLTEAIQKTPDFTVIVIFPPDDPRRSFATKRGTLSEIAAFIQKIVLEPMEKVELSVSDAISILREVATRITRGLEQISKESIENIFGGSEVFDYILQYEDESAYPFSAMRSAAAFLLINQLLFYHILSRKFPHDFPEIDEDSLDSPADLVDYFKAVLRIDYTPIFSFEIATHIPERYLDDIKRAIIGIKAIGPEKAGPDLIGTIFHDLIPLDIRKYVAAYYTNPLAAELLAWLSVEKADEKVADFACGSGGLLVAAYHRKKRLLMLERAKQGIIGPEQFTAEDHRRFLENELLGVDVMPFAAHLAAMNLASQAIDWPTNHINVAVYDSTELKPGMVIPSMEKMQKEAFGQTTIFDFVSSAKRSKRKKRGVLSLNGAGTRDITLEHYDVIIMNPPFTRQERIPDEYKAALEERFSDYHQYLHGQLGFHGYFFLLADRFLKEGGRIAFVVPATVLRVKSFEGIRRLLAEKYHVEYIITTTQRSAFSESTALREILLVARKISSSEENRTKLQTRFVTLKKLPTTLYESRSMAEKIVKGTLAEEEGYLEDVEWDALRRHTNNWFSFIALSPNAKKSREILKRIYSSDDFITLKELLEQVNGSIIRGFELEGGAGQKLIAQRLSNVRKSSDLLRVVGESKGTVDIAVLDQNGNEVLKFTVPKNKTIPTLRRSSNVDKILIDEPDLLLTEIPPAYSQLAGISITKIQKIAKNALRRKGNVALCWRFNISAPGTKNIAYHSTQEISPVKMFWSIKVPENIVRALTVWLNSSFLLLQVLADRVETEGAFIEIFKYSVEDLLVPKLEILEQIQKMHSQDIDKLLNTRVKESILEQLDQSTAFRQEIDNIFASMLGVSNNEIRQIHAELAQEIQSLKELMGGD